MCPDIEQLLLTLRRGQGKHIPLAELGVHPAIKEKLLKRPVLSLQDDVDFWRSAGYDYIKLQPRVDFHIPGQSTDESITKSIAWAPEGQGIIGSWEDFEHFTFANSSEIDYTVFDQIGELLPDGMGVIGQYGDIFTMTWELMGFEGFSYALFDNPDLVMGILDKIGDPVFSMFEYFVQNDVVDAIWYSDDIAYITGLMMSPDVLKQYFFPWLKKIGDIAHQYNKPLIYHTDGILWDVMEDIIDCGVDALHPIEPKAMDIVEVKQKYGHQLCLIGNLDVGDVLTLGTPADVEKIVRYNVEKVGYNGGYCVGSGNSIPDYVKFENYLKMIETVRAFDAS